ncbi:putative T6SS immunity periplasmic lipoprotein [Entomohabitans teleogrylli]|uniref:putative T6SS immunity periplasmic lipoprotein n=1 Tax=Entomohabitans teleogrylli TaxID=1384589 RepID=UPI00073D7A57|nr:putative T6SS immunity periplasmic lipoprotein [Entomohabitans teleogrylli]
MKMILYAGVLILLLTGCMHANDPRPAQLRAKVVAIADHVCVMVQPEGDEKIVTVSIAEVGNDNNKLDKYDLAIPPAGSKCVPDFGFVFDVGKSYNFSVILESPEKKGKGRFPAARIYNAGFTLWSNDGKLAVNPLY